MRAACRSAPRSRVSCVGLALMLPGHVLGATGAGDVKLMAAVGAIVGPALVVRAFLYTAIAGGVLARGGRDPATAARRDARRNGRLMAAPAEAQEGDSSRRPTSSRFAYGPAIAIGSVLAALMR